MKTDFHFSLERARKKLNERGHAVKSTDMIEAISSGFGYRNSNTMMADVKDGRPPKMTDPAQGQAELAPAGHLTGIVKAAVDVLGIGEVKDKLRPLVTIDALFSNQPPVRHAYFTGDCAFSVGIVAMNEARKVGAQTFWISGGELRWVTPERTQQSALALRTGPDMLGPTMSFGVDTRSAYWDPDSPKLLLERIQRIASQTSVFVLYDAPERWEGSWAESRETLLSGLSVESPNALPIYLVKAGFDLSLPERETRPFTFVSASVQGSFVKRYWE